MKQYIVYGLLVFILGLYAVSIGIFPFMQGFTQTEIPFKNGTGKVVITHFLTDIEKLEYIIIALLGTFIMICGLAVVAISTQIMKKRVERANGA